MVSLGIHLSYVLLRPTLHDLLVSIDTHFDVDYIRLLFLHLRLHHDHFVRGHPLAVQVDRLAVPVTLDAVCFLELQQSGGLEFALRRINALGDI